MNKIIIIGTEPPCPRCQLLTNIVAKKIAEMGLAAEVRHLSYTCEEAKAIAGRNGLNAGTAKDVARIANMEIDAQKIAQVIENDAPNINCEFYQYNNCKWSIDLDNLLRPFEEKAKELGIMMTPVLIINDEIKHQGSVPELSKIEKWLLELKK